jgi:hypothetical protein
MRKAGVLTPQPTGLITGYVVTRFRCIVEPTRLKPKATAIRLVRASLCSRRSGNASRTSTTPSRPPFPRGSRRSSGNSKPRNRKGHSGSPKGLFSAAAHRAAPARASKQYLLSHLRFAFCAPNIRSGATVGVKVAWPFGLERFTAALTGTGGCSLTTLILVGYSSGMSLIFPRAAKWPTLRSEPSSLQLAMGQRSKNSCA